MIWTRRVVVSLEERPGRTEVDAERIGDLVGAIDCDDQCAAATDVLEQAMNLARSECDRGGDHDLHAGVAPERVERHEPTLGPPARSMGQLVRHPNSTGSSREAATTAFRLSWRLGSEKGDSDDDEA